MPRPQRGQDTKEYRPTPGVSRVTPTKINARTPRKAWLTIAGTPLTLAGPVLGLRGGDGKERRRETRSRIHVASNWTVCARDAETRQIVITA